MYSVRAEAGGLVLLRDGEPVGRVDVRVEETCPAEFLGDLPPYETNLAGLELPWDDPAAGAVLLDAARAAGPAPVQARLNAERPELLAERRAAYEAAGMVLFQEKQGFCWTGSPVTVPDRLDFRTVRSVGRDAYRDVLARCGEATLDRNDAWYRDLAGPANWGSVFMTFCEAGDEDTWLLASLPGGDPVGVVAVSPFGEPGTATITFIGVVPEHRGNGYADDLLRAGTAVARDAGYTSITSDADVVNAPMATAFARAGHRPDRRPWHVWHYRFPADL